LTPAARVAATIELIERLESGVAADRQIAGYFRQRRYAGSKDRAAIAARVYAILRRRGELLWRLGLAAAPVDPRQLVLAALVLIEGRGSDEIAGLFQGGAFGPPPLTETERGLLESLQEPAAEPTPDWVRGAYPAWLEEELRRRFGADLLAEMAALQDRAAVDLRVNSLRGSREQALAALAAAGIAAAPTPLSPLGIRLAEPRQLGPEPAYRSGLVEPQDEGSQLAALLVDARPGMLVIDLCAGAGGKTLALAAAMENRGRLYACDSGAGRLARLGPRAARAGAGIVQPHVIAGAGDALLAGLAGQADRVLLDVPCSGTGTWRRQPEARWRLTAAELERDRGLQRELLDRAGGLVKPGGRLVYVTCSLLPGENRDQIDAFLGRRPDFRILPVAGVWAESIGGRCPADGEYLELTPRQHGTDGFFVAILSRVGTA